VLDEVVELFPGEFVHVGGDECPKQRWAECGLCQQRIRDERLSGETALQTWFVARVLRHLKDRGRRLIGWDEILENSLQKDAAVMAWRGMGLDKRAAELGHDVVTCPTTHLYFDYRQAADTNEPGAQGTLLPLETVYAFEPTPEGLNGDAKDRILGVQGNVWTEHMPTAQRVEYMVLPRACALSEVGWSPRSVRDFSDFKARLIRHLDELAAFGYRFRPVSVPEDAPAVSVLGPTAVGL
jgi:hexosaminidase